MHGGDICGVSGLNEHYTVMNYDTMGLPDAGFLRVQKVLQRLDITR